MAEKTTVKVDQDIKNRYEELSKELYGAKLSVSDKLETTLLKEIEEMKKELKKKKGK